MKNFVQEIVEDMAKYEGSGNSQYYNGLVAEIIVAYSELEKNALFKNAVRECTHPNLEDAAYYENSEADDDDPRKLRVPKGHYLRRTHPEDNFAVNDNLCCSEPTARGMKFYFS